MQPRTVTKMANSGGLSHDCSVHDYSMIARASTLIPIGPSCTAKIPDPLEEFELSAEEILPAAEDSVATAEALWTPLRSKG